MRPSRVKNPVIGVISMRPSSRPPVGNRFRFTANTMMRMSPSQKIGTDTPMSEPIMATKSARLLRRVAATTPARMPRMEAMMMETRDSSTVAGNRVRISRATGSPVL